MAYNNEQGSVSQDLKEGARSAVNAAREAKQIAKAVGRAASGDLVGAAVEAAKSKTVRRLAAFSLALLALIIFCVGYLIPMTIYEGVTSYAQGIVEEWLALFYDESGTKPDAASFMRALSATGGTLKKIWLDIADVFKGLWNTIKGTKADDTDTDGATDADLGIMVDTDDLTSVFERKFNATKDKFAGRAKQISEVIEQSSGNDSALGRAVLSRYNAVANSYIKDSSYDVQYGGFSLSVTPGKLSNKAAVTLMSLESIPFEEGLRMVENGDMPKISFLFNNLLQMTRFDKVFSHDYDSVEKTEYWKFLEQVREHAAIACATDDVISGREPCPSTGRSDASSMLVTLTDPTKNSLCRRRTPPRFLICPSLS